MLRITPDNLKLLRLFGQIRPSPPVTAGRLSRPYLYTIGYGGADCLNLWSTDNRTTVFTTVPVMGTDAPWAADIESWRFDIAAEYVEGGNRIIGPIGGKVLTLDRGITIYHLPLARDPRTNLPLPHDMEFDLALARTLTEERERARIDVPKVRDAAHFLVTGTKNENKDDRWQLCTFFGDGRAVGADARRAMGNNAVLLTAQSPCTPYEIRLRKPEIQTLLRWLTVLAKVLGPSLRELDVIDLTAGPRPQYCFHPPGGKYGLWLPASAMSFPQPMIDRVLNQPHAFAIKVGLDSLRPSPRSWTSIGPRCC